jgi:hypothetical protein
MSSTVQKKHAEMTNTQLTPHVNRRANVFAVHIRPEVVLLGLSHGQVPVVVVVAACLVAIVVPIRPHIPIDELGRRKREGMVNRWIDAYVCICMYTRDRERERDTHTHTHRERDTHTHTHRERDKHTQRERERKLCESSSLTSSHTTKAS